MDLYDDDNADLIMELRNIFYNKSDYVETASGNKLCKQSGIYGTQNIILEGKVLVHSGAVIRGDLAFIRIGQYSVVSKDAVIRPSFVTSLKRADFIPLQVGEHVFVGQNSLVAAAIIGSYVHIGRNVVIGRNCIIQSCCAIEDNAVLAPGTAVPTFTRLAGVPAIAVGDLPACTRDLMIGYTQDYYRHFLPGRP